MHLDEILPLRRTHLNPALDIGLQHAKSSFVPLNSHLQGVQRPLGSEEVHYDSLSNGDRLRRYADRLGIQAEVDDQLFRRAGHAAEIRVQAHGVFVVHFDVRPHLFRSRLLGGLIAVFCFFVGHDDSLCVEEEMG